MKPQILSLTWTPPSHLQLALFLYFLIHSEQRPRFLKPSHKLQTVSNHGVEKISAICSLNSNVLTKIRTKTFIFSENLIFLNNSVTWPYLCSTWRANQPGSGPHQSEHSIWLWSIQHPEVAIKIVYFLEMVSLTGAFKSSPVRWQTKVTRLIVVTTSAKSQLA